MRILPTTGLLLALAVILPIVAQAEVVIDASEKGISPVRLTIVDGLPAVGPTHLTLPGTTTAYSQDFANYIALATIRRHPEYLQFKYAAAEIAQQLLLEDEQIRLLDLISPPPNPRKFWKGDNEFQTQRAYTSFVDEFGTILAEIGPEPQFEFWVVEPMRLGNYDFQRGGYTIYMPQIVKPFPDYKPEDLGGRLIAGARYVNSENIIEVPRFLPVPEEKAEALTYWLADQNDNGNTYYRARVRLLDIQIVPQVRRTMDEEKPVRFNGSYMQVELVSLKLYADLQFTYLIHDFGTPKSR